MNEATDAQLATAAAAGDRQALAAIFDRYGPRVYAFCRSMLHRPADADDCLQDVFVIAATRMSGLREPERLRSWLFSVARNECLHRLDRGRREMPTDEIPDRVDLNATSPATAAINTELGSLISAAMGGLSDRDRMVIELADRQGLSTEELGAALSMSGPSAHKLLTRARQTARACIGSLLVARTGRENCGELDAVLGNWDGSLTPLLRKRIARHVQGCRICTAQEERVASPAALLRAFPVFLLPLPWLVPAGGVVGAGSFGGAVAGGALGGGAWGGGSAGAIGAGGGGIGAGGGAIGAGGGAVGAGSSGAVAGSSGAAVGSSGAVGGGAGSGLGYLPSGLHARVLNQAAQAQQQTIGAAGSGSGTGAGGATGGSLADSSWSRGWPGKDQELARSVGSKMLSAPAAASAAAVVAIAATVFLLFRFGGEDQVAGQALGAPLPPAGSSSTAAPTDPSGTDLPTGTPTTEAATPEPSGSNPGPSSETGTSTEELPEPTVSETTEVYVPPPTTPTDEPTPVPTGPQITVMSVECQRSTSTANGYVPVLTWDTLGAVKIELSIDHPDTAESYGDYYIYGEYGPSGTLELPPNGCDPSYGMQIYTIYASDAEGVTSDKGLQWYPPTDLPPATADSTPETTETTETTEETTATTEATAPRTESTTAEGEPPATDPPLTINQVPTYVFPSLTLVLPPETTSTAPVIG